MEHIIKIVLRDAADEVHPKSGETKMEIKRVNVYKDSRFSERALHQHGCFLVDDKPYEMIIVSRSEAVITGENPSCFLEVIKEFRLYAPFITCFFDDKHQLICEYPRADVFRVFLKQLQPSQFYVDEEKLKAIGDFVRSPEDIIVPVITCKDRYVSLDGHTRLYYACMHNWDYVYAMTDNEENDWVMTFVNEANKRNIFEVKDMKVLNHEEYENKWISFCENLL